MKKILLLLVVFLLSMTTVFAQPGTSLLAEPSQTPDKEYTIAIIQYINTTEEKQGYINEVIQSKYTNGFPSKNLKIISAAEVQIALNNAGYDVSNNVLPEKDVLVAVAKETKADYVVAMELSQLITTKHVSFFSIKAETKTKLNYKFYNTSKDKLTAFQTTGNSENSSSFGGIGYKTPITDALSKAMDAANIKILSNL